MLTVKNKIPHSSWLKVAPFKKHIRTTQAHTHKAYLEIVYLTHGSGFHTIDGQELQVKPGVVFAVHQHQVHHWHMDSAPEGFVLLIKHSFISQNGDRELMDLLHRLSTINAAYLQDPHSLVPYFDLLHRVFTHSPEALSLTTSLLKSTLLFMEYAHIIPPPQVAARSFFHQFTQLISTHFNQSHTVAFYAEKLHMTPQNLNAICQKENRQSASEVIASIRINAAKRLLQYSTLTIAQISMELGFNDASHFTKYFKRHSQETPKAFRKRLA